MDFFDRDNEIALLREIRHRALQSAQFTVLQGRRRVGKTELVLRAFSDEPFLYLFVTRSTEAALCQSFQQRIDGFTGQHLPGHATTFSSIFRYLLELSASRSFTVVIDEFQDFQRVNPSIFSEMQRDWDELSRTSRMNLVVSGSINTLMNHIFKDGKEPLFGRQTSQIHLRGFEVSTLKEILRHYCPAASNDDLLALWTFTGGIPKYVALLMDRQAYTRERMVSVIFQEDSYFLSEGWAVLVEEFGRDYGTYFAILAAISRGKTSRAEIVNEVGTEVSGYMTRLEEQYGLVSKTQPLLEKSANKNCLYHLDDNFLRLWFRFVFKFQHLVQVRMFKELAGVLARDYEVFSGLALEKYFCAKFIGEHRYTRIGSWWSRNGADEIDLIGLNEFTQTIDFYEIKREGRRIDLQRLQEKAAAFLKKHPELAEYAMHYAGLSLAEM